MKTKQSLLETALSYHERGLNIIPVPYGKKAAKIRWKKHQTDRVTKAQLTQWFSHQSNLAIVLGQVSNVIVRDFDDSTVYQTWANNHPKLARAAPTVKTANGFHVYVRMDPIPDLRVTGIAAGELRGNGSYTCAPPSLHPSGVRYEWCNDQRDFPAVDPADLDLPPALLYRSTTEGDTGVQKPNGSTQITDAIREGGCFDSTLANEVVCACLPTDVGQRERKLFELARRLIPHGPLQLEQALVVFDRWWDSAKDVVGTKKYEVSMNAFLRAIEKAEVPLHDIVEICAQRAAKKPAPKWSLRFCQQAQLLAGICRELQAINGQEPFFLSCRSAGRAIGTSHTFANTLLSLFERLKRLDVVARGQPGGKLATRFRYRGES